MTEQPDQPEIELGIYERQESKPRVTSTEYIAIGLSLLWLIAVGAFFLVMPGGETAQGGKPSVERKLDEIVAAQRKTENAITMFASIRPSEEHDAVTAPAIPLQDRSTAELVRSSQDVLTMMSQDGIYMDDLRPDRARPEVWRKFAKGERGRTIAGLGGVRDRTCLALTAARMREDAIFRDAVHHFLRRFDKTFSAFEELASDQDISELSDTRTARAFMLLGRVTGTFT